MKVKDLIKKLQTMDPDAFVVRPEFDHSFELLDSPYECPAVRVGKTFSETYEGEVVTPPSVLVKVVVLT